MADFMLNMSPLDTNVKLFALIKNAEIRKDRNDKPFLALTFEDRSGLLDGKLWGISDEDIERYHPGVVVYLYGNRNLYNGQPQFTIHDIRLPQPFEPSDPADFVKSGPLSVEEMKREIEDTIADFDNDVIQAVTRDILEHVAEDFYRFPAAKKHHHAFMGGLAYHTVTMLQLAKNVTEIYTHVNRDLLFSGIILHDIGKTVELSDPLSGRYTLIGNLIGHIAIVNELITLSAKRLKIAQDEESIVLLKHMVLSHHGKREYGSPIPPYLLEAEILHEIDRLDATIQMITEAIDKVEPGEFTPFIPGLEGRHFYRPKQS